MDNKLNQNDIVKKNPSWGSSKYMSRSNSFLFSVCLCVCPIGAKEPAAQCVTNVCPNKLWKYFYVSDFDLCPSSDKRPGIKKRKNLKWN